MRYDIVIKGGEVIDPGQGTRGALDIGIVAGKIACLTHNIPSTVAEKVIDATAMVVTPGLIDLHAHTADGIVDVGITPDELGVSRGVCTMCDGGERWPCQLSLR